MACNIASIAGPLPSAKYRPKATFKQAKISSFFGLAFPMQKSRLPSCSWDAKVVKKWPLAAMYCICILKYNLIWRAWWLLSRSRHMAWNWWHNDVHFWLILSFEIELRNWLIWAIYKQHLSGFKRRAVRHRLRCGTLRCGPQTDARPIARPVPS